MYSFSRWYSNHCYACYNCGNGVPMIITLVALMFTALAYYYNNKIVNEMATVRLESELRKINTIRAMLYFTKFVCMLPSASICIYSNSSLDKNVFGTRSPILEVIHLSLLRFRIFWRRASSKGISLYKGKYLQQEIKHFMLLSIHI